MREQTKEKRMSTNPFKGPASASGISWEDHLGRLFLIEPHDVEKDIQTAFGSKDAVRADVTIIDADGAPEEYTDALIFPGVLISQTRGLIGEQVLGRLNQGQAKPGQKPPWRLDEPTEDDIAIGIKYLDARKAKAGNGNPFASTQVERENKSAVPF